MDAKIVKMDAKKFSETDGKLREAASKSASLPVRLPTLGSYLATILDGFPAEVSVSSTSCYKDRDVGGGSRLRDPGTREYSGYRLKVRVKKTEAGVTKFFDMFAWDSTETYWSHNNWQAVQKSVALADALKDPKLLDRCVEIGKDWRTSSSAPFSPAAAEIFANHVRGT